MKDWLTPSGDILALIKPQFEAGRADVARGDGVVRDPLIHRRVLTDILAFVRSLNLGIRGLVRSPLLGPKGNTEFLVWLTPGVEGETPETYIENVMREATS
jgi:23S rRNA (cytidine1920-2'-O)/16S rRNA (cytidine1409-2'-O)-methyltransferase